MIATERERTPATARKQPKHESATSGVRRATGRDRSEWFAVLDEWGAPGRPYRHVADWLESEHDLSPWWAQKLIVEYEQDRGLRPPGVRPDGTFTVTASKTVAVPVAELFDAFINAELREQWLPGAVMHERTSQPGRSARFAWMDGDMRVNVTFATKGHGKCQVAVAHERLPDPAAAEQTKAFWREHLSKLKALLEHTAGDA